MLNKFRDKALLEIVVFVSGAIVMIYEIIGSRILAPHIGTSTYVWTSLIGVILGALSLGYWLGGRVADRNPNLKILSAVLFFAAALVTFTMLIKEFVFFFGLTVSMRLEFKAVIASIILFAPASILLGFVTPYAVRLKMESVADAGKTVGRLYALSTIGSILGTFAAGFLLLPFVGSTRTLYLIVIVLFLLSLLVAPFKLTAKNLGLIILFPLAIGVNEFVGYVQSKNNNVRDFDTRYNRIRVIDAIQGGTGRPVRDLTTDPFSAQSSMYLDTKQTASRYISYYHLLRHFKPDFQKTLNIGGAGYSFPKDYLQKYPGKQIDVVEIDPQMTQIARDYFYLKEDKNLRIFHEDGRIFLNETKNKYDVIVIDAFNSVLSIPFQLTTIEAVRKMDDALTDDGVVIANLISSIDGETSYLLQAEYKTFSKVFPHLYLFKLYEGPGESGVQNLILIATKSDKIPLESNNTGISNLLKTRYKKPLNLTVPILTDDLAPVEYYNSFAQKSLGGSTESLTDRFSSLINKIFGSKEF